MKVIPNQEPETPPTSTESVARILDPFMMLRDHANQWDLSAIWQVESDSEPNSPDWDSLIVESLD